MLDIYYNWLYDYAFQVSFQTLQPQVNFLTTQLKPN
jgi:hypothetical protein